MSAPNPNYGEREFDSVRRAQRAHEPSMEEILASIRAIIADDREAEAPRAAPNRDTNSVSSPTSHPSKASAHLTVADAAPERVVVRSAPVDEPAPDAASQSDELPAAAVADRGGPSVVGMRPEIEPAIAPTPEPASLVVSAAVDPSPEPLLSEAADQAVTASFEALTSSLALRNAELVESLTREMLRPMIKTWLDENLPSLVDRLVRAEIQRVARGGR